MREAEQPPPGGTCRSCFGCTLAAFLLFLDWCDDLARLLQQPLMNPGNRGWDSTMELSQAGQELRDRFVKVLLEATFPLQAGSDQELTLQALIRAAELLKERFEQELAELRQESD
jgi:hypothetical protein